MSHHRTLGNVTARSASDKTDNWPVWMVWSGTLNVTGPVFEALTGRDAQGQVFANRTACEHMAEAWIAWGEVS